MSIFNVITLFGGLAMFLFGMRMMGDGLKESSTGALKAIMARVTGTPVKAFFLGLIMTAVIQSSTATIVITSGLVGAGILTLHQSLGIIIGANVGTTITGQIIRLLDLNATGNSVLRLFQPSTLAPLALIVGIILIMSAKFEGADKIGKVVVGFGILFSGLMNMTDAVSELTKSGIIETLFSLLDRSPVVGYLIGAAVAFALQSSSATIGILQAFSTSGQLTFNGIYAVLTGIYLGDCVTTAIVCNIGAKPDARRVGVVNILFNLSKTVIILVVVNLAHRLVLLGSLWTRTMYSGGIANTNTVFNLSCALLMLPLVGMLEQLSLRIVKERPSMEASTAQPTALRRLDALSPVFLSTPGLALNNCNQALLDMYALAREDIFRAFDVVDEFDPANYDRIQANEDILDHMADRLSNYLMQISAHLTSEHDVETLNHYYSAVSEFERLGDHAVNIAECAEGLTKQDTHFSEYALRELEIVRELIGRVLDYAGEAFTQCSAEAARHVEPLEEVVDDMVNALKQNHLERLRQGKCSVLAGTEFLNMLSDIERISDICSNLGVATVARTQPEMKHEIHDYVSRLHAGLDQTFNQEYQKAHDRYFDLLAQNQIQE